MKRRPIDYEVEDLNANNRIRLDFEGDPLATARCYVARAITLALKAERIHVEAAKLRVELRKAEVWFRNEAKRLQKKIERADALLSASLATEGSEISNDPSRVFERRQVAQGLRPPLLTRIRAGAR